MIFSFIIGEFLIFLGFVGTGIFIGFFGIVLIFFIDRFSQIPQESYKKKRKMQQAKAFYYVFFLGTITLSLSWGTEISMALFDFGGLKDNIPLFLTGTIGGLWGFGMGELLSIIREIENKHQKEILSESFENNLRKTIKNTICWFLGFFIAITLGFQFQG